MTGLLNLTGWPARTRVIARREAPHPGAQLRPVECNGRRITCFPPTPAAGNSRPKLRHRRRARAEDRIRCAKDTGLANLPLHDAASNAVWLAIVLLAYDPAHLDPDAVIGAAAGGRTQDAAPAAARHRRAPDPIRAANPATAGPALALGRHGHRRRSALRAFPDPG
jgi:Transposase DDE domain group 1